MAAVQGPEGLQGLEAQDDIGLPQGDNGALQIPQDHGGDHDAAPLGHAVGFAHQGIKPRGQGRLPQDPAGQQGPLAAHAGEEDAQVGVFVFCFLGSWLTCFLYRLVLASIFLLTSYCSLFTGLMHSHHWTQKAQPVQTSASMSIWVPLTPGFKYMAGQPK